MIRAITIFTIGLAFMGLGGGFLLGAADLFDAFPEGVVASGVSDLYQSINHQGGAQFELLRIVTGTMGIEIFLRGLLGIICLFYGHTGRNLYWQLSFVAGLAQGWWQYNYIFKNPIIFKTVWAEDDMWRFVFADGFLTVFGLLLGVLFPESSPKVKVS
jgi:hypothetical protein